MSVKMMISVAAGGAIGAVGRYVVMSQVGHWFGHGFPYGTLVVNVVGSFILGALVEVMALIWSPSEEIRALVVVGMLGAFTTFSTFSLDVYYLGDRSGAAMAALYVALSVVLAVGGFYAGINLFRALLT
ncbi:MAG: fluoride efflux transporter CrcB [Rhodospirillales bacterium]|nr:fluoride efflux transporter CrcB [Rhodospirillales bacterium]MCW8861934.1 fluoride efflux transporter CrcB [Rhodospirillales bacterium]MCW8951587.1 fluoride efflux transporter CrcB [Rhodospirillales bacterium]MCW9003104.1 fluoride efflux transporter CrcB [Rhodospirillales bacterium]MCW9040604.1 fluoride efflux transporter CrcB [Rhodospirillales bacterium]